MNLSFHAAVWVSCLVLAALAPTLVRAYASYLERRTRANAKALVDAILAPDARVPPEADGEARRAGDVTRS